MINKIIGFSIKNKLIIGIGVLLLILFGVYHTTRLPIDAVPDITNNQVQIITVAPSYSAPDIERLVTFPIEQTNSNIQGITEIRSFSRFGLSLVTVVFNDQTDIYWARQQVAERLQKVQNEIPKDIGNPELGPITTGLGEIYQYIVRPEKGYENRYSTTELRSIQDWIVRRQLLGVEGVAEVSSMGGHLKQYEVAINPNQLQAMNVNINDVFEALEQNNQNTGGSYIEKGPTALFIRSEGLIQSLEEIGDILVRQPAGGVPVRIRDVANVQYGHANRYGAMTFNDRYEVAGAVVMMLKGANSNQVIRNVKARIEQIKQTLPEGITIEPFLDRTKMVNNAIGTVEKNLTEGALIVVFILVLFLGNIRAGVLVASVIPLSMLFAIILMNTFGVSGNLMSLGALDFGLIVDGAVIIVEAVMHQLSGMKFSKDKGIRTTEMDTTVQNAAGKMMNSAVFGQIIILIVYLPIFTLRGIEGKMFKPMAQTVAFALLGAFILSLTYIPMMSAWLLNTEKKRKHNLSDLIMLKLEHIYRKCLSKILRVPKLVLSTISIALVAAAIMLSRAGGEFIPALEEGDFAVETRLMTGSSLQTSVESCMKAAGILKSQFPEVEKVVAKIGNGEVPSDPMPIEAGDLMVILKNKKEWTSAETFDELAKKMSKALEDLPGLSFGFQYPVQMRFNELMTGARQDVVCKIFGENLDTLASYASQLGNLIRTVHGSEGLFVEPIKGLPQITVHYKRNAISEYNLNTASVNRIINTAFAGQSAGLVFENERRFDLVVRLQKDQRTELNDVKNLLIPCPNGTQIPLYQLADVKIENGINQIQREDAKRRIVVGFNVRGRDVQSIVQELQEKVVRDIRMPSGYYISYGGAFENLNEAKSRLMIAVPISLFLIFLLLYFAFRSVRQALLVYTAIPLSTIGGIYLLTLRDMPFSISAGIGFIALFGVAVLNGIVLIAEFKRLQDTGMRNTIKVVIIGASSRLRPVLMTAMVASLGFLPMALSKGIGAEVQKPLATVVIGGLFLATFLTLFVLPILFLLSEQRNTNKQKTMKRNSLILLILCLGYTSGQAQQTISLEAAIDSARTNNLKIKNETVVAAYQNALRGSAFSMPATSLSAEIGQVNSIYTDNRFGISQGLSFPGVYHTQKKLLDAEWQKALLQVKAREYELRKNVRKVYADMRLLQQKETLLQKCDSIYAGFSAISALRVRKGASNLLEQSTAEVQRAQIRLQLNAVKNDYRLLQLALQLLINTQSLYNAEPGEIILNEEKVSLQTQTNEQHPYLQMSMNDGQIARAVYRVERSRLLPDISLGYYNMSMIGTGADNQIYDEAQRFHSAQLTVGIPLFFRAQQARIRAARLREDAADLQNEQYRKEWSVRQESAIIEYRKTRDNVRHLEKDVLPNNRKSRDLINLQFSEGEISYLEWVLLLNQSIQVEILYLDNIQALNNSIIELAFLNETN